MPLRLAQRSPNFRVYYIRHSHTHVLKAWQLARNHHHSLSRPFLQTACLIVGIQIRPNQAILRVPSEDTLSRLLL